MRKILVLISMCISAFCFSQENKRNVPFTIRGNIGISRPVSSKAFRTGFGGIGEGNISFNLRLFDNFYAGLGYQNSFFQSSRFLKNQIFISPTKSTSIPYATTLMGNCGFLKLGYDKFFSDKGYVSYSINTGMMLAHYAAVNPDTSAANQPFTSLSFSAPFVQPEISLNFIAEDRLAFSLMLSYNTLFYNFDPKAPRLNQFDQIGKVSNNYFMSWITVGFGFTVLLGK